MRDRAGSGDDRRLPFACGGANRILPAGRVRDAPRSVKSLVYDQATVTAIRSTWPACNARSSPRSSPRIRGRPDHRLSRRVRAGRAGGIQSAVPYARGLFDDPSRPGQSGTARGTGRADDPQVGVLGAMGTQGKFLGLRRQLRLPRDDRAALKSTLADENFVPATKSPTEILRTTL